MGGGERRSPRRGRVLRSASSERRTDALPGRRGPSYPGGVGRGRRLARMLRLSPYWSGFFLRLRAPPRPIAPSLARAQIALTFMVPQCGHVVCGPCTRRMNNR